MRLRIRLPVLLFAAALVLAGLGAYCVLQAHALRSAESAQNRALVAAEETAEVSASVTHTLNKVLSYSFDETAATERAAQRLLRGQAGESYERLFTRVRELAPEQRLVVTTRVVGAAVQSLIGDRARVLVFLDQSASRAGEGPGVSAAQLLVTAEREGSDEDGSSGEGWVITALEPR
ncbi:hypothetical protein [Qaidamihabitans albus]|uniref:hypothetical protein n=1 Tax=Qaidamihabitans albus TaxID=2795733 RepID=UPI0018F27668|nr:hypothetical protein [Qaidamihabitans albus]